jgi:hypothetical protein
MNVSMRIDGEGRKALHDYQARASLTEMQCTIAAPWSYTVTKTSNYEQANAFSVTQTLLSELTNAVQERITTELEENEQFTDLGLRIITGGTLAITTNGYQIARPEGQKATELQISHVNVVTQQYLIDAINELQQKLFPAAKAKQISFILLMHILNSHLFPYRPDTCLVDVTYEATEIGIVRDGILTYCTHTPFGSFSLAREISSITTVPLHGAFAYWHEEKPYGFMERVTAGQRSDIERAFAAYADQVSALFTETGDALSIPKRIALHTDNKTEPLFLDLITKAAEKNLKRTARVESLTSELIARATKMEETNQAAPDYRDTAMLLSAQFFHKPEIQHGFTFC